MYITRIMQYVEINIHSLHESSLMWVIMYNESLCMDGQYVVSINVKLTGHGGTFSQHLCTGRLGYKDRKRCYWIQSRHHHWDSTYLHHRQKLYDAL